MPADVGVINDKYFINVAAMGAIVDVSQKTYPSLPVLMKKLAGARRCPWKGAPAARFACGPLSLRIAAWGD